MNLIFIISVGFFIFSVNGVEECADGPSYWCKSITTAELCDKIEHCTQKRWNSLVNAIDDSPKCAICNDLVNAASEKYESAPSNPVSFVRLTEMMDEFCADIRFEDVKGTCDKYMDHLIFDVFKALKFRVNPQIVCITSKYCSNDSDFESTKMSNEKTIPSNSMTQNGDNENSIRKKIDFAFDSAECFLCQTFVENVKKKVKKGQSKKSIKKLLNHECSSMPSRKLKRSCKKTIKRFHKYIVKSIMRHETSTETCSALQFCQQISQKNDFNFQADSKLKFTAHCFECKHLLTKIEHDVGTNKSKDHIVDVLNSTCTSAPSELRQQCFEFVVSHEDYIVTSIQNQATPKEICHGLGFCKELQKPKKPIPTDDFIFSSDEIRGLELAEKQLNKNSHRGQ